VVDSDEVGRPVVHSRYNNGPRTLLGVHMHWLMTVQCTQF
jgi:hypothetical protein